MTFSDIILKSLHEEQFVQRLIKDKVLVIDSSEFGYWSLCFVRGFYYGGVRRVSTRLASALIFGGAIHKGLACLLQGEDTDTCVSAVKTYAIENKLDECLDVKRTTDRATMMMDSYCHHVHITGDRIVPLEINNVKIIEQSFAFPLGVISTNHFGRINVLWSGVMDVIGMIDQHTVQVVDHKTTTIMGPQFIDDKVRSNQVLGYVWSARELLKDLPLNVEGAMINALCNRSSGFEFKQFSIPIAQWKVEEWKTETLDRAKEIVDSIGNLFATHEATPNREVCVTKYGPCPFIELCEAPNMVRERLMFDEAFFKRNEWDPTKSS